MRAVKLNPKIDRLEDMNSLFGLFDLDVNTGRPTSAWEGRNLHSLRLPFPLRSAYFPEFWVKRVQVNRRAADALHNVFMELRARHTIEALAKTGLDQFVRCYCFGDSAPSLFWYGAAWELSPQVSGEELTSTIKIFSRHGWAYCGLENKSRAREFEYW
jgi:hypothetical protein